MALSSKITTFAVLRLNKILRDLKRDGWYLDRQKGDHRQFKHPTKKGTTTVKGKESLDIYGRLLDSIEAQSGLEF